MPASFRREEPQSYISRPQRPPFACVQHAQLTSRWNDGPPVVILLTPSFSTLDFELCVAHSAWDVHPLGTAATTEVFFARASSRAHA